MKSQPRPLTHEVNYLRDPEGWVLLASHAQPKRLIVFVHGFRGRALKTWGDFPFSGSQSDYFREADMLFVSYDSQREQVVAVEHRLRTTLPKFFPTPSLDALVVENHPARDLTDDDYEELVLVGHSLGGLILRRVLTELANPSVPPEDSWEHRVLSGQVRLFSPATHGYQPAGALGAMTAVPIAERLMLMKLRSAPAFSELQRDSPIVIGTRERTERLSAKHPELSALKPATAWADPEHVVLADRYETDPPPHVIRGKGHIAVCKPSDDYPTPLEFLESGIVR